MFYHNALFASLFFNRKRDKGGIGVKNSERLIRQLQEFGLNPQYWVLKELKQKHRWILIHKREDLCLLGTTEEKKGWKNLEWLI